VTTLNKPIRKVSWIKLALLGASALMFVGSLAAAAAAAFSGSGFGERSSESPSEKSQDRTERNQLDHDYSVEGEMFIG
jgi:hypothetical protein